MQVIEIARSYLHWGVGESHLPDQNSVGISPKFQFELANFFRFCVVGVHEEVGGAKPRRAGIIPIMAVKYRFYRKVNLDSPVYSRSPLKTPRFFLSSLDRLLISGIEFSIPASRFLTWFFIT